MSRVLTLLVLILPSAVLLAEDAPVARDERLVVELFAEHPQIVTPTGLAVSHSGLVFVAESHTHFRPDDYDGPETDRILVFEDTDGDGKSDKRTVFHEGFTHVMDIEFDHDGGLWVATRRDIHRMRDSNGDNVADEVKLIVKLETPGNYPHNGLSGLAFDFAGGLHFGLGENLGAEYTLIGPAGEKLSGEAEGGSTYYLPPSSGSVGRRLNPLRRTSTGWWNPYGVCVDAFGRVFGTDNDPDSSPPCRLIQVIEGGDYGYEFRYGRSGRHPLVCWNGEIPGTLPMISGTGEAPCAIVAYESDAFPEEYVGDLLVPCWADHRIENYKISQSPAKGLVDAKREVLVEGPDDFRPVGIDVAPDGTVYVSDWVSSSYSLHKLGRIWRIRPRAFTPTERPESPTAAITSRDRRTRERAARTIAKHTSAPSRPISLAVKRLERALKSVDPRVRATAFHTLGAMDLPPAAAPRLRGLREPEIPNRLLSQRIPRLAIGGRSLVEQAKVVSPRNEHALTSVDPLMFTRAVRALSTEITPTDGALANSDYALGVVLAAQRSKLKERFERDYLDLFLAAPDPRVRFAAVKWIADEQLQDFREDLTALLDDPKLDYRLFLATVAAIDRLDGKKPSDRPPAELLLAKIDDEGASPAIRRLALRMVDAASPQLKLEQLVKATTDKDEQICVEAVRTLAAHPDKGRIDHLIAIARDEEQSESARAAAVLGLAPVADQHAALLWELSSAGSTIQREAARALLGVERSYAPNQKIEAALRGSPEAARRLIYGSPTKRPDAANIDAWLELLNSDGDASAGERIFFGVKVGTCSKCHTIDGRGSSIGPDLSNIRKRVSSMGADGKRWLLETILQPSKDMAPHFTPWQILTTDGKTLVGLPLRKGGNREAYLGTDGKEFSVNKDDIDFCREAEKSIMPDGLLQQLTVRELSDLFAFIIKDQ